MITKINDYSTGPFKRLIGNENDTPPNDVGNGSEFFDMTNKKTKLFDAESQTWDEQPGAGPSVDVQALSVTENGTYTAPEGTAYSPVTVYVPQGGGGVASNDVNFYDYDGTIVASYSAADFASLTAMPANPDRTSEGLTAQGWNWSLADAKAYVAAYGMLDIGQMYITTDGKTRVYVHLEEGRLSPRLGLGVNGSVDIDWGDGTAHDTLTGSNVGTLVDTTHTYAAAGDYVIALTVTGSASIFGVAAGSYLFYASNNTKYAYLNSVTRVEIGANMKLGNYAFEVFYSLKSITIPNGITQIPQYAFQNCKSLNGVVVPENTESILKGAFMACSSLKVAALPKISFSMAEDVFKSCSALKRITFYSSYAGLSLGNTVFMSCGAIFAATLGGKIITILNEAFSYCGSIVRVNIPQTVTTINASVFNNCYSLASIKFEPTTPPSVLNSNAFTNVPTDCKIYVPSGSLNAYKTATNYPNPNTYTYVEY